MSEDSIDVSNECGCVLVRANDKAGMEHRWWFEETDAGRLVFISEVVYYEEGAHPTLTSGRHYVPQAEAAVPPRVEEALSDYGRIVDADGKEL